MIRNAFSIFENIILLSSISTMFKKCELSENACNRLTKELCWNAYKNNTTLIILHYFSNSYAFLI